MCILIFHCLFIQGSQVIFCTALSPLVLFGQNWNILRKLWWFYGKVKFTMVLQHMVLLHIPCWWFKIENSFRLLEQNLAHFIHTVHYYACFGTSCEESKFSASYKSIPFQVKMVCQFFFFNNKRLLLLSATPSNHKLFKFKWVKHKHARLREKHLGHCALLQQNLPNKLRACVQLICIMTGRHKKMPGM